MRAALILSVAFAGQAVALTPLPPCQINEGGMTVGNVQPLGDEGSGVVLEMYFNIVLLEGTIFRPAPGPVPALDYFSGVRVTQCASATFLAINGQTDVGEVAAALGATEFLRSSLQGKRAVSLGDMKQAVRAVYGKTPLLRETGETCACSIYFPELRPKGVTPFAERDDVE